jgi:diguanylate cyclase (GGDEF)-like protein
VIGVDVLENVAERMQQLERENHKLHLVLEANRTLSSSLDLQLVLERLMDKAREVTEAEASSLMLVDEDAQELYFFTVHGEKSDAVKKIRLKIGEGIAGWVAQEGEPVLVEDAASDPRFYRKADQSSGFQTRSMMCVPLIFRKRILGTIQVLNKTDNRNFDRQDLSILQIMADQASIAIENARLHELATVDQATGLYRKDYFLARLDEEFRRYRNLGTPVSLLMSDIDHFKRVNTEYGHQGGDRALLELAGMILRVVRDEGEEDLAGRYGGEEFCVLMPNTTHERAMQVAEKIRKGIEAHRFRIDDKDAAITISIGVTSLPYHHSFIKNAEEMIKYADEALYLCKDRGRNCSALYEKKN